jgi:hypothetical protein
MRHKEAGMIPEDAVKLAADYLPHDRDCAGWFPCTCRHLREATMTAALEAAAPFIRAQALNEMTANSPRLPSAIRNTVFEIVFDVVDKFNFPAQNCGTLKDVVEIGDVCGDVEKRIVAALRARAASERGGE